MTLPNKKSDTEGVDADALKTIGARVRAARKSSGLSATEVTEQMNCSVAWLYAVETGIQNFSILMFLRLINVLKVDLSDILVSTQAAKTSDSLGLLSELADQAARLHTAAGHNLAELRLINDKIYGVANTVSKPRPPA